MKEIQENHRFVACEKKKRFIPLARCLMICFAMVTALALAGCTEGAGQSTPGLVDNLENAVQLPKEYLITYTVENKNNTISQVTEGQDARCRIYFKSAKKELLFVPVSEGYLLYRPDQSGAFHKTDETVYTQYVDDATKEFMDYAKKSTVQHSGAAKYMGEKNIAGRDSKVYEITMKFAIFTQKYTFAVDRETGICLEWRPSSNIDNYKLSSTGAFEIIKFQTENVTLPIHQ